MAEVSQVSKLTAEAVGTFALVFTVGCNVLGNAATDFAVLSIASVLMIMIYCFGKVSGGHFNPAVSLALFLTGNMDSVTEMLMYMIAQFTGGLVAGGAYLALFGEAFNLQPGKGFTWLEAGDVELHYTFLLVFTVLNAAASKKNTPNDFFALAIGFTVVAGGYAGGSISGGCFNPAVALAIDTASAGKGWGWCAAWIGFELLGACVAALLYKVVRRDNTTEDATLLESLISEFIGTYFLVYTVGLNVTVGGAPAALSIAAALMSCIYALGTVSGAHFNPAVTLATVLSRKGPNNNSLSWALAYIATQLSAGVLAGLSAGVTVGKGVSMGPYNHHGWAGVWAAECIYTFVLAFTVLCVACSQHKLNNMFGLAIGFCVVVGGYAAGGISGGHLNPAVSFGVDTLAAVWQKHSWSPGLAYAGFQACGSVLAAGTFALTHQEEAASKDSYSSIA